MGELDFIYSFLNALCALYFSVFFFFFYFRHIGHVGWDPNTGFDVSVFSSHKHYYSKYMGILWPIFRFLFLFFEF